MTGLSARTLVVDDEPQIHRFLGPALSAAGFEPLQALTAADGLRQAAERGPDLILLDLGLPDMDGLNVIPRLRAFTSVPIIILSARDREAEKIAALDNGADDYIEKPFALGELLARLRATLRRAGNSSVSVHATLRRFGDLEIDLQEQTARLGGERVHLTPREWSLLAAFARVGEGKLITQRQLLEAVWGPAHAEDAQYLRVYVGHLRSKLGAAGSLIQTEPGIGYRFGEAPNR